MCNGQPAVAQTLSCDGVCALTAFADPCASVPNGHGRPPIRKGDEAGFRPIARLVMAARDAPSETVILESIEQSVPALVEARAVVAAFKTMIRRKPGTNSTAGSTETDHGPKGQITKPKLTKRQL